MGRYCRNRIAARQVLDDINALLLCWVRYTCIVFSLIFCVRA